ncbi:MAG TPA: sigma-70 family RNA polymerase sigma factor [Vicinamibacteria bacterium]
MKSKQDESLIREYVSGRPQAYQEVHRWIEKAVDSRHWGLYQHREDILQDVHQRLFSNLSGGRFHGKSALRTYVVQIAKYTCIEFLRKKIRYQSVDLDSIDLVDANPGPEQAVAASERRERAAELLAHLPEGCRQLFEMIFDDKVPYQEISRRLGVAEGTVKSRAWRCREVLKKWLGTSRS